MTWLKEKSMEILTKGKDVQSWSIDWNCTGYGNGGGGCDALLRVEESDFFRTPDSDMSGHHGYFSTFQCPICKVWTDVKSGRVPSAITAKKPSYCTHDWPLTTDEYGKVVHVKETDE